MEKKKNILYLKNLVIIAMLSCLSVGLMLIHVPIPFAPSFLKLDVAEVPALFAGFFMGTIQGIMVILIKNIINFIQTGTTTAFVGEFMNIISGGLFIIISSYIYRMNKTKNGAILGMIISTIITSIILTILNSIYVFPIYGELYGLSIEKIVAMARAVNPLVKDNFTMMLFSVFPFNLLKFSLNSIITFIIYKRVGNIFRRFLNKGNE